MKRSLTLLCAAALIISVCGCSNTIAVPPQLTQKTDTTSVTEASKETPSTTPATEAVTTPATEAVTTPATSSVTAPESTAHTTVASAVTSTPKPETSVSSHTEQTKTDAPPSTSKPVAAAGKLIKHSVNKLTLTYDDGIFFDIGESEFEEDKNELYLVHYSDDGEVTSNIVAMCSDEDEDTKGRTVAEIGEEFMSYYVVGDNVDSSTKSMIKIGNTDVFYGTVKSSDGDYSVAATQHIYFARHGNNVYTLIAMHLDNNEEAVTKALEYTLGSMSFDNSVNT